MEWVENMADVDGDERKEREYEATEAEDEQIDAAEEAIKAPD